MIPKDVEEVDLPVALLISEELLESAKEVYMHLRLNPQADHLLSPSRLSRSTTRARTTIQRALSKLRRDGWYEVDTQGHTVFYQPPGDYITMPPELIESKEIKDKPKVVYGVLKAPPFSVQGYFSYAQLSKWVHFSIKTVKRAVKKLVSTGWLKVQQKNQMAPIYYSVHNPVKEAVQAIHSYVLERLKKPLYYGETLMHLLLSLVVDVGPQGFVEHDKPDWLQNPLTYGQMELDRSYLQFGVAFEYNGQQHDEPTKKYTEITVRRQKARDLMKLGLCVKCGVTLLTIRYSDLTVKGIMKKIGNRLPLRDLRGYDQVIRTIEEASRKYREIAKRGWAAKGSQAH